MIRGIKCTVGFNGNFNILFMEDIYQILIQLKNRFTTGTDEEWIGYCILRPKLKEVIRQCFRGIKLSSSMAIGSNKIRIAKLTNS